MQMDGCLFYFYEFNGSDKKIMKTRHKVDNCLPTLGYGPWNCEASAYVTRVNKNVGNILSQMKEVLFVSEDQVNTE